MFQHVNNVSQQMYFDLGKADFYRQVLQDDVLSGTSRIITAATANSFKEQIRMEDDIYVTTTVAKVGNKSFALKNLCLTFSRSSGAMPPGGKR